MIFFLGTLCGCIVTIIYAELVVIPKMVRRALEETADPLASPTYENALPPLSERA
jgi:hypothetical protein